MKLFQPAFLLIELMALILLVTLLITLFIGGQAQLLKVQENASKKLKDLNQLLNEYERFQGTSAVPESIQIEKYTITLPTGTNGAGNHKKWAPNLLCCVAKVKEPDGKQGEWLPWVIFPK